MTVTGQRVRQQYCSACDSDSDRADIETTVLSGCGSDSDRAGTQENRSIRKDECCDSWDSDTDGAESVTGNLISGEDRAEL